jgi:hypothetical protein
MTIRANDTATVQPLGKLASDSILDSLAGFSADGGPAEAAEAAEPSGFPGSKPSSPEYSHFALVELAIAHPTWTDRQYAAYFGREVGWFHAIIASDNFQQCLDTRRAEVPDPRFSGTLEERVRGVMLHSLAVLSEKLQDKKIDELVVVKAIESSSKALGTIQKITVSKEGDGAKKSLADRASDLVLGLQAKRQLADSEADVVDVETREVGQ